MQEPGKVGRDRLAVESVRLVDERTLELLIPDLAPCDQLLLRVGFNDEQGQPFSEQVYLTIHAIPSE